MSSEVATPEVAEFGIPDFGGFWDSILGNLGPDLTKINKAKAISGTNDWLDALKPCQAWPANLDDSMLDSLKSIVADRINNIGVNTPTPIPVGTAEFSAQDVDIYVYEFRKRGVRVSERTHAEMRRKPRTLNLLKENFTEEQQAKVVGNPFLIGLLAALGPYIVQWLLSLLSK